MTTTAELLDLLATKFKRFIYDNWTSTEQLIWTKTGTAEETIRIHELKLSTGILDASTLKLRYNHPVFNPWYSELVYHLQFNSMENVFAFFGLKESVVDPTSVMIENHVGVMLENKKMYLSTADGVHQQKVEISGIDMTRDFIYKIKGNKLYTFPLPQIIPYFDEFRIITPDRIWTLKQQNSNYPPEDQLYYNIFFIKNLTGRDKHILLKKFVYGEEYAD